MTVFLQNRNLCSLIGNCGIVLCIFTVALFPAFFVKLWYLQQLDDDLPTKTDVFFSHDFWHLDAKTWIFIGLSICVVICIIHVATGCAFIVLDRVVWCATGGWCCAIYRKAARWRARRRKYAVELATLLASSDDDDGGDDGNSVNTIQSRGTP